MGSFCVSFRLGPSLTSSRDGCCDCVTLFVELVHLALSLYLSRTDTHFFFYHIPPQGRGALPGRDKARGGSEPGASAPSVVTRSSGFSVLGALRQDRRAPSHETLASLEPFPCFVSRVCVCLPTAWTIASHATLMRTSRLPSSMWVLETASSTFRPLLRYSVRLQHSCHAMQQCGTRDSLLRHEGRYPLTLPQQLTSSFSSYLVRPWVRLARRGRPTPSQQEWPAPTDPE